MVEIFNNSDSCLHEEKFDIQKMCSYQKISKLLNCECCKKKTVQRLKEHVNKMKVNKDIKRRE
jgi:hypothetical protein